MSTKSDPAAQGTAPHTPRYRFQPSPSATPRCSGRRADARLADAPQVDATPPEVRVRRLDPDRDLRALVLFLREPIFALAPGRTEDFHFLDRRNGQPVRVTVSSDDAGGGSHATVDDADVLIPVISELTALKNDGRPLPRIFIVRPAVALHVLGRSTGGRQRRLLDGAFARLAATTIIHTNAAGTQVFRLIEACERLPGGARRLILPPELVAEVQAGRILKVDPAGLRLKGLERRLYSLARAHTGRDGTWQVDLSLLARLCPWRGTWRKFRSRLATLAAAQALPGFVLTLADRDGRPTLSVSRTLARAELPAADPSDLDGLDIFILEEPVVPGTPPMPVTDIEI